MAKSTSRTQHMRAYYFDLKMELERSSKSKAFGAAEMKSSAEKSIKAVLVRHEKCGCKDGITLAIHGHA